MICLKNTRLAREWDQQHIRNTNKNTPKWPQSREGGNFSKNLFCSVFGPFPGSERISKLTPKSIKNGPRFSRFWGAPGRSRSPKIQQKCNIVFQNRWSQVLVKKLKPFQKISENSAPRDTESDTKIRTNPLEHYLGTLQKKYICNTIVGPFLDSPPARGNPSIGPKWPRARRL